VTKLMQAILCAMLMVFAAHADEGLLPRLMQLFAQNKGSRASFVEKKYLAMIDKPVESSGELAFTAPDKLVKRTLKPRIESLVLEGDSLSIEQPGKHRITLNLVEHPEVAGFIESIRATLAGDRAALEKIYSLTLTGSVEKWQLVLIPKETSMLNLISRIQISGSQGNITIINFALGDGDRSEMVITKVVLP
jgi:Outer membrane lipoprotein carrier protein LolA-like